MTLEQAEVILQGNIDHRSPTPEQREAKNVYFDQVIVPKYGSLDAVPAHLEPDWMEGWKTVYP
jgi:hypothetical protein